MKIITELRVMPFFANGGHGTQMLYLLNGVPACARSWVEMSIEAARMWLINKP